MSRPAGVYPPDHDPWDVRYLKDKPRPSGAEVIEMMKRLRKTMSADQVATVEAITLSSGSTVKFRKKHGGEEGAG